MRPSVLCTPTHLTHLSQLLCAMPFGSTVLPWMFITFAAVLSGATLLKNLHPAISAISKLAEFPVLVLALGAHAGIAVGFTMYFFRYSV
eukprot:m.23696 g.23696  ORF g.23696 m.23696 type:complete len:89 (+) comp11419_c0_seq4:714-980(+)